MVFFVPLIPDAHYESYNEVPGLVDVLVKGLKCPILNPDIVHYPDDSFFDSSYHMRDFAGKRRSTMLGERLQAYLKSGLLPVPRS